MLAVAFLLLVAGAPVDHQERSAEGPEASVSEDQSVTVCGDCVQVSEHPTTHQPVEKVEKKKTPKVVVRASPRNALYFPGRAPVIKFDLTILDADETYWCPEVIWDWPDGTKSAEEGDCPPFQDADPKEKARKSFATKYRAFGPGVWHITATIRKAGRTIARTQPIRVTVGGNTDVGGITE